MAECEYYPGTCLTEKTPKKTSVRIDCDPGTTLGNYQIYVYIITLRTTCSMLHYGNHTHMEDGITQFIPSSTAKLYIIPHYPCTFTLHLLQIFCSKGVKKITLAIMNIKILINLYYYLLTISCDFFFSMEYRS